MRQCIAVGVAAIGLNACSAPGLRSLNALPAVAPLRMTDASKVARNTTSTPIQHVVFIIQENRSFNNLFLGFPGATTRAYGYDQRHRKISLRARSFGTKWDVAHESSAFFNACDGGVMVPGRGVGCTMDGWKNEGTSGGPIDAPYSYVPRREVKPYWTLAKQYVLADQMFTSNLDASFVSHQYAIAAYASSAVDLPQGQWGCKAGPGDILNTLTPARTYGGFITPCFDNPTIGSEADAAGLSWRYYTGAIDGDGGVWSAYQAIDPIFNGPDWTSDVINPQSQFLTDIAAGQLANVTWITPTYEASDHAGLENGTGPAWVASIVDAIGQSPFWDSTAVFIMWDDWGGWYDPVAPPYADYDGLGFRVPLMIVSPYAKQGSVTHVQYETASVLRFIEDNFRLPQLARSDARANDPAADAFNFGQAPRPFKQVAGARPRSYWGAVERSWRGHGLPKSMIGSD